MESVEGAASFEDFLSQRVNSMDMSTEVGLHVQLDDDQLCTSMRDSTDRRISEFGTLNNGNNTNNRESSMTFGKSKIKFQYSGDDATLANKKVILLVSPADLILSEIIEKIAAKLKINIAAAAARAVDGDQDQDEKDRAGSEAKKITLSYKDSDEDEEFIAILDDEDLTLAAEEGIIYVEVH